MKKLIKIALLNSFFFITTLSYGDFQPLWTIVGAGPAGLAVLGLLMDLGVDPDKIAWIDPEFDVGRLGQYYYTVPGNATTKMYIDYLSACNTFQQCAPEALDELKKLELTAAYPLHVIIDPLRKITECLKTKVHAIHDKIKSLHFDNETWHVATENNHFDSHYVVLATGSHPKEFDYPVAHKIPLDLALNKSFLAQHVRSTDTIAVVGSAHSAMLILKFLSELPVGRIVNFYKNPLVYVIDHGTWAQHQQAGLKGTTAEWAKNVLEKNPPANLVRIFNTPESLEAWLPICNKIIYAVGYEPNQLPPINGKTELIYDDVSGIIAPRLFGIGIAFPEKYSYPDGSTEYRVGLRFFMEYAQRVVPEWMTKKAALNRFASFESLFMIDVL
ncbi:FAD/NAD(P)-binding protein [Candidatus Dependentiae bacterium]|nr:FAD/NAD(P)-binding protein [Candidatus Dependentiae bacterium]